MVTPGTLSERLRALHCIRCFNVVTGKPKTFPCQCSCHKENGNG